MAIAPRERPEVRVSTASLGIDGEGETWKELDQGQHREGLAHTGGSEGGRWPLGLLVPEKLLSRAGGKLQPCRSWGVEQQPSPPGSHS